VFLQKTEASLAALLVQSRATQKNFLFLLEEKIGRAQMKSRENFFAAELKHQQTFDIILPNPIHKSKKRNLR
jgi:hypothetical protein